MRGHHIFETAIGWAGIAWSDAGLIGVHLPEQEPGIVRESFARRHPGVPDMPVPEALMAVVKQVQALMRGEKVDLSTAPLDMSRVPEFSANVYAITRAIPAGETLTYGEVATRLGDKQLAREVGAALGKNPWPIIVPCHRVTAAGGKLGGFSARGGAKTKLKLLEIEGAKAAYQTSAGQGDLFG